MTPDTRTLFYCGSLKNGGLVGKSGRQYYISAGQPFDVLEEDADPLVSKFPGLILYHATQENEPDHDPVKTPGRKSKPVKRKAISDGPISD